MEVDGKPVRGQGNGTEPGQTRYPARRSNPLIVRRAKRRGTFFGFPVWGPRLQVVTATDNERKRENAVGTYIRYSTTDDRRGTASNSWVGLAKDREKTVGFRREESGQRGTKEARLERHAAPYTPGRDTHTRARAYAEVEKDGK